jgi:hypothetical protein
MNRAEGDESIEAADIIVTCVVGGHGTCRHGRFIVRRDKNKKKTIVNRKNNLLLYEHMLSSAVRNPTFGKKKKKLNNRQ